MNIHAVRQWLTDENDLIAKTARDHITELEALIRRECESPSTGNPHPFPYETSGVSVTIRHFIAGRHTPSPEPLIVLVQVEAEIAGPMAERDNERPATSQHFRRVVNVVNLYVRAIRRTEGFEFLDYLEAGFLPRRASGEQKRG